VSNRQKRIGLLIEHRKKQLDDASIVLGQRRRAVEGAKQALERAEQARHHADAERRRASERGVASHEWVDLNGWCETARRAVRQTEQDLIGAEHDVETAQKAVLSARAQLKQVEALAQRLQERRALEERRAEQRDNDERNASAAARTGEGH